MIEDNKVKNTIVLKNTSGAFELIGRRCRGDNLYLNRLEVLLSEVRAEAEKVLNDCFEYLGLTFDFVKESNLFVCEISHDKFKRYIYDKEVLIVESPLNTHYEESSNKYMVYTQRDLRYLNLKRGYFSNV